jgi:hypothetical protein
LLILLAAAGLVVGVALWLPTRNDSASANENGQQSQDQYGDGWHRRHDRHHGNNPSNQPSGYPSGSPSAWPTSSEPPMSEPPSAEPPTSEGPTEQPPTSVPPTTIAPPSPIPTTAAPDVTAWAPFTDYVAGQLVSFAGKDYQVLQTHTSLPGWEPPKLPELFKLT